MKNVIYFILVSLLVFTSCKKNSNPTSPSEDTSTVTYSGKVYHTLKIGNQTWLKENLDVGTMIQGTTNSSNNGVIEKYCYNNDPIFCKSFGGFYQWDEAMQYATSEKTQGICPKDWHIPTISEFETLKSTVNNDCNVLKAEGQGAEGGVGTNTSGYSALLVGRRFDNGSFEQLFYETFFWSSEEGDSLGAYNMGLWSMGNDLTKFRDSKKSGFNIRCIKDN